MRVVFVDDEPQVLRGITRMLDCADVQWDIDTVGSGIEALQLLAEKPADVVVSDMKMPGMDGAELLTEVERLYPSTVRIVLSGQIDKDAVDRPIPPVHEYLFKPCAAETLKATIIRSRSSNPFFDATRRRLIRTLVGNSNNTFIYRLDFAKETTMELDIASSKTTNETPS